MCINSNSDENNIKQYSNDEGILSIMYHRFNETKYPSTNIEMTVFKKQIEIIKNSSYSFLNPNEFEKKFLISKIDEKNLLIIKSFFEYFLFALVFYYIFF